MPKIKYVSKMSVVVVHKDNSETMVTDEAEKVKEMFRYYVYCLLFHREENFKEIRLLDVAQRVVKLYKQCM